MATIIPFPARASRDALAVPPTFDEIAASLARLQNVAQPTSEVAARLHWQLDALNHGLKLLGSEQARHFPTLSAALANIQFAEESGHLNGTTSRNACVSAVSSCA
jgi:hypothetical protein